MELWVPYKWPEINGFVGVITPISIYKWSYFTLLTTGTVGAHLASIGCGNLVFFIHFLEMIPNLYPSMFFLNGGCGGKNTHIIIAARSVFLQKFPMTVKCLDDGRLGLLRRHAIELKNLVQSSGEYKMADL